MIAVYDFGQKILYFEYEPGLKSETDFIPQTAMPSTSGVPPCECPRSTPTKLFDWIPIAVPILISIAVLQY